MSRKKLDPLKPEPGLLIALGSAIVHADEARSEDGHYLDWHAFDSILSQPDVKAWMEAMDAQAFLPKKRNTQ